MTDIPAFSKEDALKCLKGKSVVFLGDSLMRQIYQDFVTLLCSGKMTSHQQKLHGERTQRYLEDRLVPGTGQIVTGRGYREEREMKLEKDSLKLQYCFLTQCWNLDVKNYLERARRDGDPDLILVLSCLWDINRWGSGGIEKYKTNCKELLRFVRTRLGGGTQLVWLTCPPIAVEVTGGVVVEGMEGMVRGMRFNVMEANLMVATETAAAGYDVLDLHYHLMHQVCGNMLCLPKPNFETPYSPGPQADA